MPKRTDIHSILIIGAGPIIIGQACEFDYSGTQACKALKEEGYRVILINSNPATIMTDPGLADATYVEPITPEMVEKIIAKERPDALLPTMGGQTALNCALALHASGVLEKYNVEMIGAKPDAIDKAENRKRFNEAMAKLGLEVPRNRVVESLGEAKEFMAECGLPAIIRPSFTMGGTGGGVARSEEEFEKIVLSGLDASPTHQVLIDESLLGWKEYEMEVIRDKNDNCIIVCSIENVDPMGVHTGDSITVAPALTLTDKEYQIMRDASCAVLREIGVETGGSNVQFGVDPKTGRMVVIEMNPRVSRSSALASKATGFPIAKVAAKLAVGYTLDELANDVVSRGQKDSEQAGEHSPELAEASRHGEDSSPTRAQKNSFMPASFEPTIDYVVTKIPRFTFEKFAGAKPLLTSAMKSVGEAMAIGGTFQESLQKALRSLETGLTGLNDKPEKDLEAELSLLTPKRILLIAQAFREGWSVAQVHEKTAWDPWFLEQIQEIVEAESRVLESREQRVESNSSLRSSLYSLDSPRELLHLKQMGFSDARLAQLSGKTEAEIRSLRHKYNLRPVYKRVDTCAAEFEAATPYMYSTYWGSVVGGRQSVESEPQTTDHRPQASCEASPTDRKKVMILGGGPNRIGQGIEFDYACVHAAFALKESGVGSRESGKREWRAESDSKSTPSLTALKRCFTPPEGGGNIEFAVSSLPKGIKEDASGVPSPFRGEGQGEGDLLNSQLGALNSSFETIMVNCNPETVSTDYDTSDRLYFEPLTLEDVLEIVHVESSRGELVGLNVQFGGQTPLKLARGLKEAGVKLLGTSPESIDLAEDREQFKALLDRLKLKQPQNAIVHNREEVLLDAKTIGYPIVVRPSFVLGGRAMAIVANEDGLLKYLDEFPECFDGGPLLLDRFLKNATEVDVDAISDGRDVFISGIMEHIEQAGVHSGDSACTIPPHSLPREIISDIKRQTRALALELNVQGLINVQYAVMDGEIYILEVNPRASRTVPFVAKATGLPVAKIAARVMAGDGLVDVLEREVHFPDSEADPGTPAGDPGSRGLTPLVRGVGIISALEARNDTLPYMAVKEVVFPFARFEEVDVVLGPEMKSTGEVMGIDMDFASAFAKAQIGTGFMFPESGAVFISVRDDDKPAMVPVAKALVNLGFTLISTHGTAAFLREHAGVKVRGINKVQEGSPHIVDLMKESGVQLLINTTEGARSLQDSFSIRRTALLRKIPYTTTATGAAAIIRAMERLMQGEQKGQASLDVTPLQALAG